MATPPEPLAVDLEAFATEVLEYSRHTPVLVDLWADWCPPCRALAPHLTQLQQEFAGRLRVAKVDVDAGENMKLAGRYQVRGFPTVIAFVDGAEVERFAGAKPLGYLRELAARHLPEV